MDIKEFRASIDAGKGEIDALASSKGMKDITYYISDAGKIQTLKTKVFIQGLSCEAYANYYNMIATVDIDGKPVKKLISKFIAGVILGCYDKDPAKGGELVFTEKDAEWLDASMNATQTLTLFSDIMTRTGINQDVANVEKPS